MSHVEGSGWRVVWTTGHTGSPLQDLHLVGVHEDGRHLLLVDADGDRFRLSVDEAVRSAVRRARPGYVTPTSRSRAGPAP